MTKLSDSLPGDTEEEIAIRHEKQSALLDYIMRNLGLKNDAAMARKFSLGPPVICKLRNGHMALSSAILLVFHEGGGYSIKFMKNMLGMEIKPSLH